MSLWGSIDNANNKPKFLSSAEKANTYGVDATEIGVTPGPQHTGWVEVTLGQGPISSVAVSAAGTSGWSNGDQLAVTGGTDQDAVGGGVLIVTTTASGNLASVSVSNGGLYTSAPTVSNTGLAGRVAANSDFTVTLGGRAGRKIYETLVAGGISGDAEDTLFPDS